MMASSLRTLIRFLLPQQLVARYMESKIPVPTDNIFKFYALFSLLLLVFSLGAALYVQQLANERVVSILPELEVLKQAKELSVESGVRKYILERQLEVNASDKKFFLQGLGALIGFSVFGLWYGFRRWHTVIQPLQDESAKVQLEIARIQLAKMKAELDALTRGSSDISNEASASRRDTQG